MKKFISMLCALSLCMASGIAAVRADEEVNHSLNDTYATNGTYTGPDGSVYKYTLINDGKAVCLNGHGTINGTEIILPDYINDLPVEKVDGNVIAHTNVTSLTLPKTCRKIFAFGGNEVIETIILNEGLEQIETFCFNECKSLKNINIPFSVTEIENKTFYHCSALESIEFPSSITKIGDDAFNECTSLTDVKFNNGLLSIGQNAFIHCNIKKLTLPDTLVNIKMHAFMYNSELKKVEIPSSVKNIGNSAFARTGLENVKLHGDIETMGYGAFGCEGLKDVTGLTDEQIISFWNAFKSTPWAKSIVNEDKPFMIDSNNTLIAYVGNEDNIIIPDGVKTIGDSAFAGKSITSVTIPSSVTAIEQAAFYQCKNLKSVIIPGTVARIGGLAFAYCSNLENVTFEYSTVILSLGSSAFQSTAITKDTFITNNRKYTDKQQPFSNTALDPDYDSVEINVPTAVPTDESTSIQQNNETLTVIAEKEKVMVLISDRIVDFDDEQPFIDENDRTQIPIRAVAEALDCTVSWDEASQTAAIIKGNEVITVTIGSKAIQANGKTITMDTAALLVNDRTYIPIRFVGEALGITIDFQNKQGR